MVAANYCSSKFPIVFNVQLLKTIKILFFYWRFCTQIVSFFSDQKKLKKILTRMPVKGGWLRVNVAEFWYFSALWYDCYVMESADFWTRDSMVQCCSPQCRGFIVANVYKSSDRPADHFLSFHHTSVFTFTQHTSDAYFRISPFYLFIDCLIEQCPMMRKTIMVLLLHRCRGLKTFCRLRTRMWLAALRLLTSKLIPGS